MGFSNRRAAEALGLSVSMVEMYLMGRRKGADDRPVEIPEKVSLACQMVELSTGAALDWIDGEPPKSGIPVLARLRGQDGGFCPATIRWAKGWIIVPGGAGVDEWWTITGWFPVPACKADE